MFGFIFKLDCITPLIVYLYRLVFWSHEAINSKEKTYLENRQQLFTCLHKNKIRESWINHSIPSCDFIIYFLSQKGMARLFCFRLSLSPSGRYEQHVVHNVVQSNTENTSLSFTHHICLPVYLRYTIWLITFSIYICVSYLLVGRNEDETPSIKDSGDNVQMKTSLLIIYSICGPNSHTVDV